MSTTKIKFSNEIEKLATSLIKENRENFSKIESKLEKLILNTIKIEKNLLNINKISESLIKIELENLNKISKCI